MRPVLATLDIGNSAVKLGWFRGQDAIRVETREGLDPETGVQWISVALAAQPVDGIAIACVVPRWRPAIERLGLISPIAFVGEPSLHTQTRPAANLTGLGADRWMAAEAAWKTGQHAVAVTLGTATTFTLVDASGTIAGGAIAPGLGIAAAALAQAGAQLFAVTPEAPRRALGADTESALRSGIVFGHAALVEGMVARLESEWGHPLAVVVTGGWLHLLGPLLPPRFELEAHLVLRGLAAAGAATWGGTQRTD